MKKQVYVIREKKSDLSSLTKYVIFSLGMVAFFTVVMIVVFCIYQSVPDTLITCFFAVFGGEVLSCALIKIFKLKSSDTEPHDYE